MSAMLGWFLINFIVIVISLIVSFKLLPKLIKIDIYKLIEQGVKAAGYYYIFAALFTGGIMIFTTQLTVPTNVSFLSIVIAFASGLIGIVIALIIAILGLKIVDYLTPVDEWKLIENGNEAAGLYFVGVGILVFILLYSLGPAPLRSILGG